MHAKQSNGTTSVNGRENANVVAGKCEAKRLGNEIEQQRNAQLTS